MMKRFRWVNSWLIGAAAATLLFVGLNLLFGLRYENSDDMLLVKTFMGFDGGQPVNFTLYTHTFLAWILGAVSTLIPGVAWFSVFQLMLLWLSVTAIVKCSFRLARFRGLAGSLLFTGVFAAFVCARLNYTTTAALAGAAAVMQLFEYESCETPRQRCFSLFWGAAFFLCAYSLRQMVALPLLAYCLLVLVCHAAKRFRAGQNLRPALVAMAVLCGLLALFAGIREWEITARGQRETLTWQQSRIELFDYTSFEGNIAPALEADSGLTDEQVRLVQQWYFWDSDIDAQALQTLTAAYAQEETEGVLTKFSRFLAASPRYAASILCLLLLFCLIALWDRAERIHTLTALLALLGGLVMIVYLCWRGRVLYRGLDTVFLPCAAVLLALVLKAEWKVKNASALVLCTALLLAAGTNIALTGDTLRERPDWLSQQREADLEAYALKNPDQLVVRTPNLLRDTRLLPDVSGGLPVNTAIWGDWYCRMPGWWQQLAAFGLDGSTLSLNDWVNSCLVFATADEAPPQVLTDAISATLGRDVLVRKTGTEGSLNFFTFE